MRTTSNHSLALSCFAFAIAICAVSTSAQAAIDFSKFKGKGKLIFVRSKKAKNKNPGTQEKPIKNIDKAIAKAQPGDTLLVAEGRYKGTFGVGYWEIDKSIRIFGGFKKDFSERDPSKYHTLLQPKPDRFQKSGTKYLMFTKDRYKYDGIVIDGLVFEQGQMIPYVNGKGQPKGVETGMMKVGPGSRNPANTCLALFGTNIVVRNNSFINCGMYGVTIGMGGPNAVKQLAGKGKAEIANNIFVANRFAAIQVWGTERTKPVGTVDIHHNTVLFTWSRLKDFGDQGYGLDIKKGVVWKIHDNIIAWNIGPAINHQWFAKSLYVDRNLFCGNKKKDIWFNPKSNVNVRINADEFEDLELDSVEDNENKPFKLPVDKAYLAGVLAASYSEQVDYNPDSEANRMRELFGLNKQGKIHSKVSMFANRYPWKSAFALFGAMKDRGAQKPK